MNVLSARRYGYGERRRRRRCRFCYREFILLRTLISVVLRVDCFTGVQKIIVPCTSLRTSKEALRLARIYPGALYSTAGIDVYHLNSFASKTLDAQR